MKISIYVPYAKERFETARQHSILHHGQIIRKPETGFAEIISSKRLRARNYFRFARHPIAIGGERQFHLEFRGLEDIPLFASKPLCGTVQYSPVRQVCYAPEKEPGMPRFFTAVAAMVLCCVAAYGQQQARNPRKEQVICEKQGPWLREPSRPFSALRWQWTTETISNRLSSTARW